MRIFCQINLCKPPDGAFYSGEVVSGMIKYALDEPMEIEKITISLKGLGHLRLRERQVNRDRRYTGKEVYIDTDKVIQEGKYKVPAGSYELKFNFRLPQNIPTSFDYNKHIPRYAVKCSIKYYIRIRFDRPGWFALAKHFRKQIDVASTIIPKLSMEPIIYGERSTLLQLFSSKISTVIMKANILNSVIVNRGKIEIQFEIQNDTNVIVKSVKIKLIEVHTFKATGHKKVKAYEDIPNCDTKIASIKCGANQNMSIDIIVPSDRVSLDHSKIVSRDYKVRIIAELPMPHRNVVLEIPVQIGDDVQRDEICGSPPTYWEAMDESPKDNDARNDKERNGKKS